MQSRYGLCLLLSLNRKKRWLQRSHRKGQIRMRLKRRSWKARRLERRIAVHPHSGQANPIGISIGEKNYGWYRQLRKSV